MIQANSWPGYPEDTRVCVSLALVGQVSVQILLVHVVEL